jgi:type IV pilus assembly protein PilC
VRALYVLSEQTANPKLNDVVVEVRKDVEAGSSLSEALEKHPEVFSRLYTEMVKAGEIGGILDGVLLRLADQLERDQDLRRKIRSALTYPTVVLVLAILAASFMLIFIVPVFAEMFQDLGGTLPLPTRICMAISDILTSFWGVLVYAGIALAVVMFLRWKKVRARQEGVGAGCAQDTGQDRRRREEGNPCPLRAHLRNPERCGGAHTAGYRGNRNLLG